VGGAVRRRHSNFTAPRGAGSATTDAGVHHFSPYLLFRDLHTREGAATGTPYKIVVVFCVVDRLQAGAATESLRAIGMDYLPSR
jgi:hypothetical protein